jgi:hypothetical protein
MWKSLTFSLKLKVYLDESLSLAIQIQEDIYKGRKTQISVGLDSDCGLMVWILAQWLESWLRSLDLSSVARWLGLILAHDLFFSRTGQCQVSFFIFYY